MSKHLLEIHCPNCGEIRRESKHYYVTVCPDCGSDQVISLPHDREIDKRFKLERGKDV